MVSIHALGALALIMQTPVVEASRPAPLSSGSATVAVARRADTAPVIDGSNSDAIWLNAVPVSSFRQWDPVEDGDPSFRTEFRVAYDDRNLYVYVRAYDPHPDSIMRALTRRDTRGPSDQIVVFIDSYSDRRTGFEFGVNPDGVKRDYAVYNDGNEDGSWNAVWDVATTIDSLGWAAEYRIPLSQLRFADADEHTFGFGVFRDIERYRERVSWPLLRRNVSGLSSQMATLSGIRGISGSRSIEITPYTVAQSETRPLDGGQFDRGNKFNAGADIKLRITPNVTLDATVNPDFGQVESDPAVLNLSAFETFLGERRPFFIEGTGVYRFAINCYAVIDCSTNEGLFYSRRIGRTPFLRNDYGDNSTPTTTPIATAAKLTGRTRSGLSFGLLDAVTQHVDGVSGTTVEPRTNYAVLSAEQDLRGGKAGVRVIATAVNRALDEWTEPVLHSSAYASGISARSRMFNGRYEASGSFAASRVAGTPDVIRRTQRNAVHYYQQPDDDLTFDSTRTSLSGNAFQLKFGKIGGGITRFETSFVRQSAGFDVNDIGFLRRADNQDWSTWAALRWNQPRGPYRWLQINGNHWQTWNTSGTRLEMAFNANAHMGLRNNWDVHAGGTVGGIGETYCDRCTRGGPLVRRTRGFYPWFGVNTDSRRMIAPSMWVNLGYSDEGRTRTMNLNPSVRLNLSTRLQAQVGANFSDNEYGTQWLGNFTEGDVTHYSFAALDQQTLSMNVRVNYAAGPNLTFEFYGEPFVSTGTYSNVRELSATPVAPEYEDRFIPYEPPANTAMRFRFRQLRTNSVVRWEYMPGSTVYLVWAHGRNSNALASERPWVDEYRDLFELHPDNTFLIKVAYWFNR